MTTKSRSVPLAWDYIFFGNTINAMRVEMNLTQYQLGVLIDKSASFVSEIESGKAKNPEINNVLALANVFDIDIREFFYLEDTRTAKPARAIRRKRGEK